MPTLDEIVAAAEARAGQIVTERAHAGVSGSLPIRQHKTGDIVAWVRPAHVAANARCVVLNGLVVGYYVDTTEGRFAPAFRGGEVAMWLPVGAGEEWMCVFSEEGRYIGNVLLR